MDAAHFVLGSFPGPLWCFKRVQVETGPGRQRWNGLGAVNAISKDVKVVIHATTITALEVCLLLKKLKQAQAREKKIPITVVLDNSRYQRCYEVQQEAKRLDITLLFLLPSFPESKPD